MKRAGKSYLAVSLTRFQVRSEPKASLLTDLDDWLQGLKDFCNGTDTISFIQALRNIKAAMFELSEFGGSERVQKLLMRLSIVERLCANNPKARELIRPLEISNVDWLYQAEDRSDEWAVAVALASLYSVSGAASLRAYMSPISTEKPWMWSKEDNPSSVVWGVGDVSQCMVRVLERRLLDWRQGQKEEKRTGSSQADGETFSNIKHSFPSGMKPFHGSKGISLRQLHAFLYGNPSMKRRVGELLWALLPFTTGAIHRYKLPANRQDFSMPSTVSSFVPWAYVTSRLVVSPDEYLMKKSREQIENESDTDIDGQSGFDMPIPGSLIELLASNRLDEAVKIAEQRLISSGFQLRFRGLSSIGVKGKDIAAALLIPLDAHSTQQLLDLAKKIDENPTESQHTK